MYFIIYYIVNNIYLIELIFKNRQGNEYTQYVDYKMGMLITIMCSFYFRCIEGLRWVLSKKNGNNTFDCNVPVLVARDGDISNQFVQDFLAFCDIPWDDNLAENG